MAVSAKDSMVGYRTEALARVGLTRRSDLRIADFDVDHLDMMVQILLPDERFCFFGVDVKGTDKALATPAAASKFAEIAFFDKGKANPRPKPVYFFPVIGLLYSMKMDSGYWFWLTEPVKQNKKVTLHPKKEAACQGFDRDALDLIVQGTLEWWKMIESSLTTP